MEGIVIIGVWLAVVCAGMEACKKIGWEPGFFTGTAVFILGILAAGAALSVLS